MQVMQWLQCSRHRALNTNPYGQDHPNCTVVVRSIKLLKATREVKHHQSRLLSDVHLCAKQWHMERALWQVKPGRRMYPWRRRQLRYQGTNESEEKVAEGQQRQPELLKKAQHWLREVEL